MYKANRWIYLSVSHCYTFIHKRTVNNSGNFPAALSIEEPKPDESVLLELERDYIFPLRKVGFHIILTNLWIWALLKVLARGVAEVSQVPHGSLLLPTVWVPLWHCRHLQETHQRQSAQAPQSGKYLFYTWGQVLGSSAWCYNHQGNCLQIKTTDLLLRSLPLPCKAHEEALTLLVQSVYNRQSLPDPQLSQRTSIFDRVSSLVHSKFPGMSGVDLARCWYFSCVGMLWLQFQKPSWPCTGRQPVG